MDPKQPLSPPPEKDYGSPADEADDIGGDVNPYPVGQVRHALEESRAQGDIGSPFEKPLETSDRDISSDPEDDEVDSDA